MLLYPRASTPSAGLALCLTLLAACAVIGEALARAGDGSPPAWIPGPLSMTRRIVMGKETWHRTLHAPPASFTVACGRKARKLALSAASAANLQDADTVDELLQIVARGLEGQYSVEERQRIDELIAQLDAAGEGGNFLEDQSLSDYYRVQFTRDVARGKPVGGDFRYSVLGRALFKTEDALQHVVGNEAVNMLFFKFAGICPGCVVLKGKLTRCPADERRAVETKYDTPPPGLSPQTIKVIFDPPRIFFGSAGILNFELGPVTTVYLDTTYLDERVRIGRNRFGGHFVFTRLPGPDKAPGSAADSWRPLLARPKVPLATVRASDLTHPTLSHTPSMRM